MSDRFDVGEVAIYCRPGSVNNGREVTIISPLTLMSMYNWDGTYIGERHAYEIDGDFIGKCLYAGWCAEPCDLRKKKPPVPRQELGEWDLCPWRPLTQTVRENDA